MSLESGSMMGGFCNTEDGRTLRGSSLRALKTIFTHPKGWGTRQKFPGNGNGHRFISGRRRGGINRIGFAWNEKMGEIMVNRPDIGVRLTSNLTYVNLPILSTYPSGGRPAVPRSGRCLY